MHAKKYPFAVRLIGFAPAEEAQVAAVLDLAPHAGPAYFCLSEDSLQEPDLFVANGQDLTALATLAAANPSVVQPALLIGAAPVELPYPSLERPIDADAMGEVLAELIAARADALSTVSAAGQTALTERRRRKRLDFDLTDPAEYEKMRRPPPAGAVLIVDKGSAFRDHVAKLLGASRMSIEWTDSARTAIHLCDETPVSLVLINTTTPDVDPYLLCRAIKDLEEGMRIAVVFLVGSAFQYDSARARAAGVRGMLNKPVADRHMLAALKRLLSLSA